jgi:hypothetical protein
VNVVRAKGNRQMFLGSVGNVSVWGIDVSIAIFGYGWLYIDVSGRLLKEGIDYGHGYVGFECLRMVWVSQRARLKWNYQKGRRGYEEDG